MRNAAGEPNCAGVRGSLAWLGAALLGLTALTGCGGGSMGAELSLRPKGIAVPIDGKSLHVPADERFNIISYRAEKEATLDSTASSDASATQTGAAAVSVSVSAGGTASATMQVGHAFTNDSSRQVDVSVNVSFAYDAHYQPKDPAPTATLDLKLYARDGKGRLIFAAPLLEHSNEGGPMRTEGDRKQDFTVTLGPGEGFYAYVAGGVSIDAKPGRGAEIGVQIRDLQMDLTTRAAPAVKTAADPS
ncbi:MAG: hypothetical protein KDA32_00855 [Phycisphaerales bacterium]|nr:hypothetical protein [Phycisphaerales bacterium]